MRFRISILLGLFVSIWISSVNLSSANTSSVKMNEDYLHQPLLFEPNLGQADSSVEYLGRSRGYFVELTRHGAKVSYRNEKGCDSQIEIRLENSQSDPVLIGLRETGAKVNYFSGNDPQQWKTNIPTFGAILYKDVYPGIDWMFYEKEGLLEYDFIVSPGADSSLIRLKFENTHQISLDASGNVNITTQEASIQMLAPMVYQENRRIEAQYHLSDDHQIRFSFNSYDSEKAVIIDPVISFGTYLGGTTYDTISDVGVDNKGNFYAVGYTEVNTRFPGFGDGVVYKFNPSGNLIWSAFLIGNGGDSADAIAVSPNGASYIAGTTNSRDFPIVGGFQTQNGGGNDAFVVKLAANGSGIIRSSYLGGSGNDGASGIEIGSGPRLKNGVYVTGKTDSRNFPRTKATQQQFGGGRQDGYLAIIHAVNFQRLMSTYVGSAGADQITSLGLNTARGDLYAGIVTDTTVGTYITQFKINGSPGPAPAVNYVTDLRPLSNLTSGLIPVQGPNAAGGWLSLWGMPYRGELSAGLQPSAGQQVVAVAVSPCIPQPPATSCTDNGTLLILNQDLNQLKSVNFGGPGPGVFVVNDITADKNSRIYLVGDTLVKNSPVVNAFQTQHKGGWEGFVIAFAAGSLQTTLYSYLGGAQHDFARGVAVDKSGNIFVAGETSSKKFPTTAGALDRTLNGTADGFVVKITQ